jgi:hypothetical protein
MDIYPLCLFPETFLQNVACTTGFIPPDLFRKLLFQRRQSRQVLSKPKRFFVKCEHLSSVAFSSIILFYLFYFIYLESSTVLSSFFESQDIERWVSCISSFNTWYAAFSLTEEYRKQFFRYIDSSVF